MVCDWRYGLWSVALFCWALTGAVACVHAQEQETAAEQLTLAEAVAALASDDPEQAQMLEQELEFVRQQIEYLEADEQ